MAAERSQIDEIKEKLDIVNVAESYLSSMKRSGANYFALCPFHNEKTPSFSINQDLQLFKCFGCGESGDVIAFIQKLEGLDFPQTLERAATMAGVTLKDKPLSPRQEKARKEKEQILKANELAMKYFNYMLLEHKVGQKAREYCKNRKINKESINKYQIGYAPDGYEYLKGFLKKKGFSEGELVKWGLLVKKKGRVYDKFRDRLMFPIFDHQGNVVGFSGRQLEKSEYGPKYLNSPETPVYKKKETLYGLHQARDEIRRKRFAILVEGNVDILSSFRVGVKNIVCPLGTALTQEQAKLLKRYADKVYLALDTDEAGEKALIRAMEIFQNVGLETLAIDLGKYQDSDELIMNEPEKWGELVSSPIHVVELLLRRFANKYDLSKPSDKSKFVRDIAPFIRALEDEVEKQAYISRVARDIDLDQATVLQSVNTAYSSTAYSSAVKQTHGQQESDKDEPQKATFKAPDMNNRKNYLAAILLQYPKMIQEDIVKDIYDGWFVDLLMRWKESDDKDKLLEDLEERKSKLLEALYMYSLGDFDSDAIKKETTEVTKQLRVDLTRERIKELRSKINQYELQDKESTELMEELQKHTKLLQELMKVTYRI